MNDAPHGPGWWRASDGRWYPPYTRPAQPSAHPGHRQPPTSSEPAAFQQRVPAPLPNRSGVPKSLVAIGVVVIVMGVLGFGGCVVASRIIGNGLGSVAGGECTFASNQDMDSVMGGEFDVFGVDALFSVVPLDNRVLADATSCWASESGVAEDDTRLVRIARMESGDAQTRFHQERTLAQGATEDRGGGITVESEPYFYKDVTFGDEAFCTTTDATGFSGVLVRRADILAYVSLTSGVIPSLETAPNGGIRFAGEHERCDLAQKVADKVR